MARSPTKPRSDTRLQSEVLSRILAVSRHLGASADLREILSLIIDAMRDTLDAERATVFEFDPTSNELFTTVAHGLVSATSMPNAPQREIRVPVPAGLAGECAQSKRIISVPDAYADGRFNPAVDRQTGFRTQSILTIPLVAHDGELVGVAQVLNKRGGSFTAADEELAQALAAQAAVAIKRGRLIEDRLVRQKLERDLELARTIQQSSFPRQLPALRGFDLATWNQAAEQTGGDVYDVITRSTDHRSTSVVLLMADATGHGIGPALSVTQLRSMARMAVRLGAGLVELARQTNRQLCDDLPVGRFITAWFGELDATRGTLASFSAGQGPLIRYSSQRDAFESLDADAPPLGVLEQLQGDASAPIAMSPGDLFAVISDGIYEARNVRDEQFGAQRVIQSIRQARGGSAQHIIEELRRSLEQFTGAQPADDDRTAIIIKRVDASA